MNGSYLTHLDFKAKNKIEGTHLEIMSIDLSDGQEIEWGSPGSVTCTETLQSTDAVASSIFVWHWRQRSWQWKRKCNIKSYRRFQICFNISFSIILQISFSLFLCVFQTLIISWRGNPISSFICLCWANGKPVWICILSNHEIILLFTVLKSFLVKL